MAHVEGVTNLNIHVSVENEWQNVVVNINALTSHWLFEHNHSRRNDGFFPGWDFRDIAP